MRVQRITKKSTVDPLKRQPPETDTFIWERETVGFGLRATPAGKLVYVFRYQDQSGKTKRVNIGQHGQPWTVDEARARAVDLQRAVAEGRDPGSERKAARVAQPLRNLAEAYFEEGPAWKPSKKARTWTHERETARLHILPYFGARNAKNITRDMVVGWYAQVSTPKPSGDGGRHAGGPRVATTALITLSNIYQWAIEAKGEALENPTRGVRKHKPVKRERFLTESEVARLNRAMVSLVDDLDMLRPASADCFRLLMLTGCRKEEVASLRWEFIDLDRGLINLPDSKTGAKVVVLALPAVEMLAAMREQRAPSPWVFPASRGAGHISGLQKEWEMIREWAGVDAVRIHDLRHSFASFAAADGASLLIIGKALGHTQASTTERYAHLSADPVRQVANAAAARIARAFTSKSGGTGGTGGTALK